MRLHRDTDKHLCLWCGASEEECLNYPPESTALTCCPDCDHGQPVSVVPWCAEHDSKMLADLGAARMCQKMFYGDSHYDCRLEEPARVFRIANNG